MSRICATSGATVTSIRAGYTELLRQSFASIKAVAPEVQVLAGALAPTLAPEGSPDGMDDLVYPAPHV